MAGRPTDRDSRDAAAQMAAAAFAGLPPGTAVRVTLLPSPVFAVAD
jgi:hypothetical protein